MLARRMAALAVFLSLLCAACARPFDMVQEPRLPSCRGAVDVSGRPSDVDVHWFAPAARSDRRLHAEWCGTVGPMVIEHTVNPERRAEAQPHTSHADEIAVVSWNVHVGGGDVISLIEQLRDGRWSDGRPITHFVLLLQEVVRTGSSVPALIGSDPPVPGRIGPSPPNGARMDVTDLAERFGLSLFYAPSMRNGRGGTDGNEDRGNAILATLPLSDLLVIELPFERQRRVAVGATIHIAPGHELRLCSVHLDNRVTHRRLYVFAPPGRTRQTKGLLDALPDDGPLILGGDFNTWLGRMEGTLDQLRRAFPETPPGGGATFGGARLDHIFFRLPAGWRAESRVLDHSFGSDHRPVLGLLRTAELDPRGTRH
jgi:endonuclease/exonuclease/phosphatase family metal-dependent hydrolase